MAARVVLGFTLAASVFLLPARADEDREESRLVPDSYARFQDIANDSPDESFFASIGLQDLPTKFDLGADARLFRYKLTPGSRDYYLVFTQGDKTSSTPRGPSVVNHRMEVLLDYATGEVTDGVASIRQTVHDFYVTARRPLRSPDGSVKNILIRKRWLGDVIKVWSEGDLLADNQGTTGDAQGAGVVQHLTSEIERMTRDITFLIREDGRTTDVSGPEEFVALFENDFGCPFGLVLPEKPVKPGATFSLEEKSPITEITVSGQCKDDLITEPVEKMVEYTYLGDAKVGRYDCAVFRAKLNQRFKDLTSSRTTPYGDFPVAIESVEVERVRTVYFARTEGKVVAYDAQHRTKSRFAIKTPMGDKPFETDAKTRWTMLLHDGLKFDDPPRED